MIGNAVPVNLAKFIAETVDIYSKTGQRRDSPCLKLRASLKCHKRHCTGRNELHR